MQISIIDMFTIGIGPSSSHTVGPMRASVKFIESLTKKVNKLRIASIKIELFG